MKFYAARQAIFNKRLNVVAYEMFYRSDEQNRYPSEVDPHLATSKLLVSTHFNNGFASFSSGKPVLLNFSEQSILDQLPHAVPRDQVVIEILEDVTPNEMLYQEIKSLFHAGYRIALDDFVYKKEWNRFLKYARLVKFDIQHTALETLKPLISNIRQHFPKTKILAEKVETHEEFAQAKEMGFDFFQGYFFCKPEMVSGKDAQARYLVLLAIYNEVLKDDFDIKKISDLYKNDLSLTYKLLRFINSGLFPISTEISSVHQALVYIGEVETRKFVLMLFTAAEMTHKPRELINDAILRAKFCEQLALRASKGLAEQAFMIGLFSLIDAILDRPMREILDKISLDPLIKHVLLDKREVLSSPLAVILKVVKLYISGSWHLTATEGNKIGLTYDQLGAAYEEAICMVDRYNNIDTTPAPQRVELDYDK